MPAEHNDTWQPDGRRGGGGLCHRGARSYRGALRCAVHCAMPDATILITSKDRRDELRVAIDSAVRQTGADIEVLVIDDGSSDGTSAMVAEEFPEVRLVRNDRPTGYPHARNQAAALATAPVIVTIDDDAEFSDPWIVCNTLAACDHPSIITVAMPHIHTRQA